MRQTKARRNWLYVAIIQMPANEKPETGVGGCSTPPLRYQVFFTLRKAVKDGLAREDLEMIVESAYAEDQARKPDLLGRVMFVGLATATVEGRDVHRQRSRKR